ncbi:diacylglycerol/lipid kinase family protein [Jeotgalibacillus proteolyticus]|nr:diacylglycerol kinase family protein [Jeotgalibacillus proteolyticus]
MKVIVIVNPHAKNGMALKKFTRLIPICEKEKIDYWITAAPLDAVHRMKDYLSRHPDEKVIFLGVGGDGTMHELINGAAGFPNALIASISAGSGNDFGRHYSSFPFTEQSLRWLKQWDGKAEKQDSVYFKGDKSGWFVNNLGIGFDALVAYSANQSFLKKWFNRFKLGKLIYAFYLLRHLFRYQPQEMEIWLDGKAHRYKDVWFITAANQPYYGGGMKIAPSANSSDGILDMIIVHQLSRWKFLAVFISVFFGSHLRFKEVEHLSGRKVQIKVFSEAFIHADGEFGGVLSEKSPLWIQLHSKSWNHIRTDKHGS